MLKGGVVVLMRLICILGRLSKALLYVPKLGSRGLGFGKFWVIQFYKENVKK